MNELARILAALSAAFLLRSFLFLVAMIVFAQAVSTGVLALRDAPASRVTEARVEQLEDYHMAIAQSLAVVKRELTELGKREAAPRETTAERLAELEKRHSALVTFVAKMSVKTNDHAQQLRRENR